MVAEVLANALNAASILLAGRNSIHTWWTGIAGCALFGWVFFEAKLYADVTLQVFFIGTSVAGFLRWRRGDLREARPVGRVSKAAFAGMATGAIAFALAYSTLLHRFTDAAAPLADSAVLAFSVLAQFLLVARRVETWWCWLAVNSVAVPLFASRGLHLTAGLYFLFWINAWVALVHWRKLAAAGPAAAAASAAPGAFEVR